LTVSTAGVAAAGLGFLCSLLFPVLRRPAAVELVTEPWSPSMDTLAAVAAVAFICLRLYVTDVSMPLRRPEPADLGGSAETDDAREVDADFFPPENQLVQEHLAMLAQLSRYLTYVSIHTLLLPITTTFTSYTHIASLISQ